MGKKKTQKSRQRRGVAVQDHAPKLIAALRLGFFSRHVGLEYLQEAIAALHEELHPSAVAGLMIAVQQAEQEIREFEHSPDPRPFNERRRNNPRRWKPSASLVRDLRAWTDTAIAAGSPFDRLYRLGAAMGNYFLGREGSPERFRDAEEIRACLRLLPRRFLAASKLGCLVDRPHEELTIEAAADRAIGQSKWRDAPPLTANPGKSVIIRLLDVLVPVCASIPGLAF